MRHLSLVLIASLAVAPGCNLVAIPPAVGAGGGALVGAGRNLAGHHTSVVKHAFVGLVAGIVFDVIAALVIVESLNGLTFGPSD
jgi:hypothetical protein